MALVADELVLGDLGALGPLDAQVSAKQRADFPVDRSCLEAFQGLSQLRLYAHEAFGELVQSIITHSGMGAADACRTASEFIGTVCAPLFAQIDPRALGEHARALEVGVACADRCPAAVPAGGYAENGPAIIRRLVWEYPSHGFVIDREELTEIGVPVCGVCRASMAKVSGTSQLWGTHQRRLLAKAWPEPLLR